MDSTAARNTVSGPRVEDQPPIIVVNGIVLLLMMVTGNGLEVILLTGPSFLSRTLGLDHRP